jgi:phosphomethylpyrimidine synthase
MRARAADPNSTTCASPGLHRSRAARCRQNVTQMHYARQGIITPEMEYVAIRENGTGRRKPARHRPQGEKMAKLLGRQHKGQDFGAAIPAEITPSSCATKSPAAAPSSPTTSTTPSEPMIIGRNFLVKINANIGNSAVAPPSTRKWTRWSGPSAGARHGDGPVHRQEHPRNPRVDHPQQPVPIGTVPIYQALEKVAARPRT